MSNVINLYHPSSGSAIPDETEAMEGLRDPGWRRIDPEDKTSRGGDGLLLHLKVVEKKGKGGERHATVVATIPFVHPSSFSTSSTYRATQ